MLDEYQMKIVKALIDTVERTTDLDAVYNDKTGEDFWWTSVYDAFDIPSEERNYPDRTRQVREIYKQS